ncbi:hypothetical protein SMC26_03395 [Actinomadura fulvescens]|uniref:DNA-binding protein n=1 Tax=Actinomadura fulvescens TaxID=46160 RepID=A0ABN3PWM9_9ACTN
MSVFTDEDVHLCMPAPQPRMVRAARDYLTPRFASGVDAVLWEIIEHPLPDLDAIDAVNTASARTQSGAGDPPEPMAVAAALVVLGAARLDLDQTEARLLNTAQASGMDWQQIVAILGLTADQAEERYRQLKPRLDEPAADTPPPHISGRPSHRPRAAVRQHSLPQTSTCRRPSAGRPATWDDLEDEPWEPW